MHLMQSSPTILVTGGCGFIGSAFIRYLFSSDSHFKGRVINIDNMSMGSDPNSLKGVEREFGGGRYEFRRQDLCDKGALDALFKERDIDIIVHFAASSHVDRSIKTPVTFVENNIISTLNLLDAARCYWGSDKYRLFHLVSTDEVYGDIPLDSEKRFFEGDPFHPRSPYAASKASCESLAISYHYTYGINLSITRSSNNFGPYQAAEKLIPLMIGRLKNHEVLPVYGNGLNVRDWIYVNDNVRAIYAVILKQPIFEIYNIGAGNEYSNIDLVEKIISEYVAITREDESTLKALIKYVSDRPGHDKKYSMDYSKIKRETGFTPKSDFTSALRDTVKWYAVNR